MTILQLQLDEATYSQVEQRAYLEGKSLTATVRDALIHYLDPPCDCAKVKDRLAVDGSEESDPGSRLHAGVDFMQKTLDCEDVAGTMRSRTNTSEGSDR